MTKTLDIYVKTNTGNIVLVSLDLKWHIKTVKENIAPKIGFKPDEMKIIFAGKELSDSTVIEQCGLKEQSILHAVQIPRTPRKVLTSSEVLMEGSGLKLNHSELSSKQEIVLQEDKEQKNAYFYVFCATCKTMRTGKLRVRCNICKSGAFKVYSDPQSWADVLEPKRITGQCMNSKEMCADIRKGDEILFAEFYFKCAEHPWQDKTEKAIPLQYLKPNLRDVSCLVCSNKCDPVFVFPCADGHVTCLDCFRQYCSSKLWKRQFQQHPEFGYTLVCPVGCADSFIVDVNHFKLLTFVQYKQCLRFGMEEHVLRMGGVLCPRPGCGMANLPEPDCKKVQCLNGCGFVFCRNCLQNYHIGECANNSIQFSGDSSFAVDPTRAATAKWDEASTVKLSTKPCPKCCNPTKRDGGCMHMVCTRAGCEFHWCWVCQTEWTRECMGSHWFG